MTYLQQDIKVQSKRYKVATRGLLGEYGKGCESPLPRMCEMSMVEAYKTTTCTFNEHSYR